MGHTPQISGEVLDLGYLKCIDAFCHGGGWLTEMEVGMGMKEADGIAGVEMENPGPLHVPSFRLPVPFCNRLCHQNCNHLCNQSS